MKAFKERNGSGAGLGSSPHGWMHAPAAGFRRSFRGIHSVGGLARWVLPAILLTLALPAAAQAAFLGTNGKIAFQTNRDGNNEIYSMNTDGSGLSNLTSNGAADGEPAWSADGSKIAFVSYRDGNGEIYVMNADGSGVKRLTNNPASDFQPAWSPDGTKITFARSEVSGVADIYVMNADGSNQTRLTNMGLLDTDPVWSPDGSKIAFVRAIFGGTSEVWVMNAGGSGQLQLSPSDGRLVQGPDWSPDGTKIAYGGGFGFGQTSDVYVINADGTGQTNLTSGTPVSNDQAPAWSPDGSRIAFTSDRDGNGEIYVMNADGSAQTNLTNNPAEDSNPAWQPFQKAPTTLTATPLLRLPGRVRATLTSMGAPLAGVAIKFSVGVTTLCSATTAATGSATCSPSLFGLIRALLAHGYTATFAGDADHNPSSAHAGLL